MSALLHIKGLIVSNLSCDPELKRVIIGVMNSIDSDLDILGYETSAETDESIEALDGVLIGREREEDEAQEYSDMMNEEIIITRHTPSIRSDVE